MLDYIHAGHHTGVKAPVLAICGLVLSPREMIHSLAGHLDDDVRPGQGGLDRLAQPTARLPMFTCAHERRTPHGITRCRACDLSTRWIPDAMGIHFREGGLTARIGS